MSKRKVLIVTQELDPFTALSDISKASGQLPKFIQNKNTEIRILMPRFGLINERRHSLHEVVRLSGINIIVDDEDFPLIIKVASLPGTRMQVYFLDNEDFFKRKALFHDEDGKPFEDNIDRMVFFCKGVIETVKKFGWPPDVIYSIGWMSSLVPFYLKTTYGNEPILQNSKFVYSVFDDALAKTKSDKFFQKATINELTEKDMEDFKTDDDILSFHKGAILHSDAIIKGSENLGEDILGVIEKTDKPVLEFIDDKDDEINKLSHKEFFLSLLEEEKEEEKINT